MQEGGHVGALYHLEGAELGGAVGHEPSLGVFVNIMIAGFYFCGGYSHVHWTGLESIDDLDANLNTVLAECSVRVCRLAN